MRRSYKLLLPLALIVAFVGLSCQAVSRLAAEPTGTPPVAVPIPIDPPLVFKPDQLPEGQVGVEYEVRITVEKPRTPAGGFSLHEGNLPPGLDLKKEPGQGSAATISGTPTQAGTYKFVVHVWCYGTMRPGQTGEKQYTIVVK